MEEIEVTIKLKAGKIFMRFGDCFGSVRNEEGNVVGGIGGTVGCGYDVEVEGKNYHIGAKDLWDAVVKKLGRNDLVFEK